MAQRVRSGLQGTWHARQATGAQDGSHPPLCLNASPGEPMPSLSHGEVLASALCLSFCYLTMEESHGNPKFIFHVFIKPKVSDN